MTHMAPMPDSAGTFTDKVSIDRYCRTCAKLTPHTREMWESSCGGFEDYRFTCTVDGTVHWVDGPDS